jgi:hypothetical protein
MTVGGVDILSLSSIATSETQTFETRRVLMGKQQATRLSASVAPTTGNMYISPLS